MCFTLRLHTSAAPPRVGLTQALGCMIEYLDQLIFLVWALVAFVAISGLYPATRLLAASKPATKNSFLIVAGLAAAAPLAILAFDRLQPQTSHANDASALQNMPIPIEELPALYALSAAVAALLLWFLFAWHSRTAA